MDNQYENDCRLLVENLPKKTFIDYNENNGFITEYSDPMINFKNAKVYLTNVV